MNYVLAVIAIAMALAVLSQGNRCEAGDEAECAAIQMDSDMDRDNN